MFAIKKLTSRNSILWGVKIFFLTGYLFMEFITEGSSYYHEYETLVILSIFILGTFYCNHACPYGIISELFEKLGKWLLGKWRKRIQFSEKLDTVLRYVKYIFGVFFLWIFISGTASYWGDHGTMYMSTPVSKIYLIVKMFLGISVLSFFFDRFFCRYLCYQKAWYNVIELISPTRIVRNKEACSSCKICDMKCPMNVPVSHKQSIRSDKDCISCYNCVKDCPPKQSALSLKFFGWKVNPFRFVLIAAAIYFVLSWVWARFDVELLIQGWLK
jgi:ferredoxin-type protein NapH